MRFTKYTTILLGSVALLLGGCGEKEKKTRPWSMMPNMHHQESVRPQEAEPNNADYAQRTGRAMREPVEGSVPMDFSHYGYAKMDPKAAELENPLPNTMEVLKAGRRAYNIYCMVCHGERGEGDGNIIPNPATPGVSHSGRQYKYTMILPPMPINTDSVKMKTDGALFNYITKGGAMMPKYNHINAEMRWSIVHYLRVLYKASHATDEQLKDYEANKSKWADPTSREVVHDWRD